jgi:hypothetical protein
MAGTHGRFGVGKMGSRPKTVGRELGYLQAEEAIRDANVNVQPESNPQAVVAGITPGSVDHGKGECNPCAYFWQKADGCRMGAECEYCHLCDRDAIRRWKREKKQRKKAEANVAVRHGNAGNALPVGAVNTWSGHANKSREQFYTAAREPARVDLPVPVQSSAPPGIADFNLVGLRRPYLPMKLVGGAFSSAQMPMSVGLDFTDVESTDHLLDGDHAKPCKMEEPGNDRPIEEAPSSSLGFDGKTQFVDNQASDDPKLVWPRSMFPYFHDRVMPTAGVASGWQAAEMQLPMGPPGLELHKDTA